MPPLRVVAWEVTRACNLACQHCRAEAVRERDPSELDEREARSLLEDVASFSRPTFILTGGEPLLRPDLLEIAAYGFRLGLRMVLSSNGTTLTPGAVRALKQVGIRAVSVSLDGARPSSHDAFRGEPGTFAAALEALRWLREEGLPFQINTTVTRRNLEELPGLLRLAEEQGAVTWDVFLLVPTGRAQAEDGMGGWQYEEVLGWLLESSRRAAVRVKVTCGPMYARLWRQEQARSQDKARGQGRSQGRGQGKAGSQPGRPGGPAGEDGIQRPPQGCMAGDGFCFISRTGQVFPCGYFPVAAGSIREQPLSVIYREATLFAELRDPDRLRGRCGRCEYRKVCRGCRARALALQGDYLAEDPYCGYQPRPRGDAGCIVC